MFEVQGAEGEFVSLFWTISQWVGALAILAVAVFVVFALVCWFVGWLDRPWSKGDCACGDWSMRKTPHVAGYLLCHSHALKCEKARGPRWESSWWFALRSGLARSWADLWWWL